MGRVTWGTRLWGGAALLLTALTVFGSLFRSGAGVPRVDVAVLSGAALLCAAGWVAAGVRANRRPRPAPTGPAEVPAPPRRLPHRVPDVVLSRVILALLAFVPAAYVELGTRPDGDHARLIAAIQEAGARTVQGHVSPRDDYRLRPDGRAWRNIHYRGDAKVLIPGRKPGTELSLTVRGVLLGPMASPWEVTVLYAPDAPELGAFVDETGNVALYAGGYGPWLERTPTASGGGQAAVVSAFLALLALFFAGTGARRDPSARFLRADVARADRVPAIRAEVVTGVRDEYTTVGSEPGRTEVKTSHWLRLECADGTVVDVSPMHHHPTASASLAVELAGRPGWLMGAERWRTLSGGQPVVFVTDDGEALWLFLNRRTFEAVLGNTSVETSADRRVRPVAARTDAGLLPARLPWLGTLALAWALVLPVLLTPSTRALSWTLCGLSLAAVLAAMVVCGESKRPAVDRADGWEVIRHRNPVLDT
ncbi:hypothetical protein JNUCC64_09700 [Streptomyces sp. JNUCC 64]